MQRNVLEYLENSAMKYPDKIAFTDMNREETFKSFSDGARAVGSAISERTQAINRPIVVLVDRNVDSLIAMMGVLYSGNFYVPLDNKMPMKRLRDMLAKLEPELVLYNEQDESIVSSFCDMCDVLAVPDAKICTIDEEELSCRREKIIDTDPVYVIYTSGSTGTPKGIVVSHRNVINLAEWLTTSCGISEHNVLGSQTPFFFDASVKDIYSTLKCSASLHILPPKYFMFPVKLMEYINDRNINTLMWATSAFNLVATSGVLEEHAPLYVRKLIVGGETLLARNLNIWKRALTRATFINVYGPTEVTVDCTYYIVDRDYEDHEAIPIGKACENKEVFLLDSGLRPVRKGKPGEICVRGTGVANGYYNDEEHTKDAFVQNPLNPHYPEIIYRTGDIAYENAEGLLVFQSRADGQIKHMGYRIELGEVERAIITAPDIKEVACVFDKEQDKIICFYVGETESRDVLKHTAELLPKYMCPNVLQKVEFMPTTANGKIDRRKLREDYDNSNA